MKLIFIAFLAMLAFSSVYAQNSGSEQKRMDREINRFQIVIDSLKKLDDIKSPTENLSGFVTCPI